MTEEDVTKAVIAWLKGLQFEIIHFDYPGSGTGKPLHPNQEFRTNKNAGAIIPDIIASRGKALTLFENKVWFSKGDIDNLLLLRNSGRYTEALDRLLSAQQDGCLPLIGTALSKEDANVTRLLAVKDEIDFAIVVNSSGIAEVVYAPDGLFA